MLFFASDFYGDHFRVVGGEGVDDECEVASSSCAGHFPCEGALTVAVDVFLYSRLYHGREHCCLCVEGCSVGFCEGLEVCGEDCVPAG